LKWESGAKKEMEFMGFDFLRATPEERVIMILTLVGFLAVAGILYLYDKRKRK
jgi:LPXTG-motif cell wall-anchored protein